MASAIASAEGAQGIMANLRSLYSNMLLRDVRLTFTHNKKSVVFKVRQSDQHIIFKEGLLDNKELQANNSVLLKEIYDLQDDLEWICHSHFMLYHSGSHREPGIHFPREINDLDENHSMYWSFRSDSSLIWLDLVVSPTHMDPQTDVRLGFCLVNGMLVNLDYGDDEGRLCFNRLLECMKESCDQLEIVEKILDKEHAEKLRRFAFGYKKAVERGDPIDELGDEVHEMIAAHLRVSKSRKKKKKSKKKKGKEDKKGKKGKKSKKGKKGKNSKKGKKK